MSAERLPATPADRGMAPRWKLTCADCGSVRIVRGWPSQTDPNRRCAECAQAVRKLAGEGSRLRKVER
jgi:hypothetical protein